jgi:MFS family permease
MELFKQFSPPLYSYLSDCTDQGSRLADLGITNIETYLTSFRAKIFSRFAGLYYTGVALGPTLGAFILQKTSQTVDIFYFSIGAFALCLLFVVLILPESLTTEARLALADRRQVKKIQRHERRATAFEEAGAQDAIDESLWGFLGGRQLAFRLRRAGKRSAHFLSPVRLFLPYHKPGGGSDWSLTILSLALFGFYLTVVSILLSSVTLLRLTFS